MKQISVYVRCVDSGDDPISLTVGELYETLPASQREQDDGWLRIIDNEGQPYLHPAHLFIPVDQSALTANHGQKITVHLDAITKLKLRDQANARGISMSALMRELVEERLDLPEAA
ncbi:MAG: CopG family transcriptional regulator [Caldilineaceae bacterium]|nr:CopG family transcriptional regulator [Caldilineaceae bacterium]